MKWVYFYNGRLTSDRPIRRVFTCFLCLTTHYCEIPAHVRTVHVSSKCRNIPLLRYNSAAHGGGGGGASPPPAGRRAACRSGLFLDRLPLACSRHVQADIELTGTRAMNSSWLSSVPMDHGGCRTAAAASRQPLRLHEQIKRRFRKDKFGDNEHFGSCKQLGPSCLDDLHESKLPFVSPFEFVCYRLPFTFARVTGVAGNNCPSISAEQTAAAAAAARRRGLGSRCISLNGRQGYSCRLRRLHCRQAGGREEGRTDHRPLCARSAGGRLEGRRETLQGGSRLSTVDRWDDALLVSAAPAAGQACSDRGG